MQNDDKIKIPLSILNNPIHEVRPLVVSLYYKTPNPGVGTYNVSHANEISKIISDPNKLSYRSVFDSKKERFNHEYLGVDKDIVYDEFRKNDYYEVI